MSSKTSHMYFSLPLILVSLFLLSPAHGEEKQGEVRFNRDIRPLLSDNCFLCHGPDHSTRKAGLRLDIPEGLIADLGDGRQAVKPGDPENSELYKRLTAPESGGRMPPLSSHKELSSEDISLFKAWISEGAEWKNHWSFNSIERSAVPVVSNSDRAANEIDHFILNRLEAEKLSLSAEADKNTLIRRVSFDLRGLPPTPTEIENFIHDASPNAYANMVDAFLASEQFGEHRTRYWLDGARYSDTHGFHFDNYRSIWPYRDWVIKAFNQNMPFDQFTIEQLAGDLLPNATPSQKVATGFNRCNPTTNEGGAIADEYLAIYAQDRAEATSTVWLGLTFGCAACHDHKFDPLSQRDFYRMTAFFRNTTQQAMDKNAYDTPPTVRIYTEEEQQRVDQITPEIQALKKQLGGLKQPSTNSVSLVVDESDWIAADARESSGEQFADFSKDRPFTFSFWVFIPGEDLQGRIPLFSKREAGAHQPGWSVNLAKNKRIEFQITTDFQSLEKRTYALNENMVTNAWNHVSIAYSGLYQIGSMVNFEPAFRMFINGRNAKTKGIKNNTAIAGDFRSPSAFEHLLLEPTGQGVEVKDLRIFNQKLSDPEKVLLASTLLSDAVILTNKSENVSIPESDELKPMLSSFRTLDHELARLRQQAPLSLVMEERKDAEPFAHVLNRGQYDQLGERVTPGLPDWFPDLPQSEITNRLSLARWLVAPDNPLPARVTVNRFWQELFGTGLVKTTEDFGSQGEPPSHIKLLDWLAAEFIESGWDVKHMYRLMLMSSTYRQRSVMTPDLIKADPENRLLAHGPRYRLDAEVIRDQALYLSQLLVEKVGGPPVKPYQPKGVWQAVAYTRSNTATFEADQGDKLYRRSLYTFWKRTAPPPSMSIFDAPSRESCTVRRERTNTPLQALVLMNDPQYIEAARNFAQVVMASPAENKFAHMLAIALGTHPEKNQWQSLKHTYDQVLPYYQSDATAAKQLIQIGDSPVDASIEPAELAAWTVVANQVMNLDTFITKN